MEVPCVYLWLDNDPGSIHVMLNPAAHLHCTEHGAVQVSLRINSAKHLHRGKRDSHLHCTERSAVQVSVAANAPSE